MEKPEYQIKYEEIEIEGKKIKIKSLSLEEIDLINKDQIVTGEIKALIKVLELGIVEPLFLKENAGKINAGLALTIGNKILALTGLAHAPQYNPSER